MATFRPTLLCILDGFGLNPRTDGNAIALANKPCFDSLWKQVPSTTLVTFGERVGLPEGQMGNSEVGHLNIGAGRVVEQWLLRISRALQNNLVKDAPTYRTFLGATKSAPAIHLVGLCSDGGVHSHVDHLRALLHRLRQDTDRPLVLHLITDGRDTGPTSGQGVLAKLEEELRSIQNVSVGTVIGRFHAMDRDKRWERTEKAYRAIIERSSTKTTSGREWLHTSYASGITDEFIEPAHVTPYATSPNDGWIFWNFREDRMRQIVNALCGESFGSFQRAQEPPLKERVLCFTEYDHAFGLPYLFPQLEIQHHLGEVVSQCGLKQLRCAETEKYPHVTYFLNGGIEKELPGEVRRLVPSPRDVKTYDLKPEMSAHAVTDLFCAEMGSKQYALGVLNFANCDMVGHTGVLSAAVKAVETVDSCLKRVLTTMQEAGGQAVIIADHGNAEQMINYEDGTPHTAHTTYPVPMMVVGAQGVQALSDGGALCDVAPTLLALMGIPQPAEMTGRSLLR